MHEGRSPGTSARQALKVQVAGTDYVAQPDDGAVSIGRELPAQIRIDQPGISRIHARLEPAGDHWTLTDAGSRNGTFLDGRRIESIAIERDLDVYLGDPQGILVQLRPASGARPAPTPTETFGPGGLEQPDEPNPDEESTEAITPTVQVAVTVDAADIAIRGIYARAASLPVSDDPRFAAEVATLLAELRRLEASLTNAMQNATGRPELAVALGEVRQAHLDLMRRAARADAATLGQRLFVARHQRHLTVPEAANAAGVTDADVINAEADVPVPASAATLLQRFVDVLDPEPERS